jgi:hypothetical protein
MTEDEFRAAIESTDPVVLAERIVEFIWSRLADATHQVVEALDKVEVLEKENQTLRAELVRLGKKPPSFVRRAGS